MTNNDIHSVDESVQSSVRECEESLAADIKTVGKSVEDEDVTVTTTVTTYSKPDSTGKQYVQSVEERKAEKKRRTDRSITTEDNSKQTAASVQKEDSTEKSSKSDESKESVDTEEKTSTPAWLVALIIGIVAIVAVALVFVIKRYVL